MAISTEEQLVEIVAKYRANRQLFDLFMNGVEGAFLSAPELNTGVPAIIHSIRKRLKDEEHLLAKVRRKATENRVIDADNLFAEVRDLAGLRLLHLHQEQFGEIHKFVMKQVKNKVWRLAEKPIAYTWDPESVVFFKKFKLRTEVKASYYTSVHYLILPANDETGTACCEVQVRTLFEEAWGEIDHSINYPERTEKLANLEQLRVLSKLVSTGSRLADSIFKIHYSNE